MQAFWASYLPAAVQARAGDGRAVRFACRLRSATAEAGQHEFVTPHRESIMAEHSRYQQNIIKNYYQNREAISLQRLQEAVTDLYLAEGKKRTQQWKRVASHLEKLGLKPDRIQRLVERDDPAQVARVIEQWMSEKG